MSPPTTVRSIGQVADDAAAGTAELPVRMGAVADDVVGTVSDGDKVHLVADLNRRLRVNAEGGAASGAAITGNPLPVAAKANASDPSAVDENDVIYVSTTLAGRLRTQSAGVAAHGDAVSGNPVLVGAKATSAEPAAVDVNDVATLSTDLSGRLRVNLGATADNGTDTAAMNPAKVGAVVDEALSVSSDGRVVHLVTDMYRRLRTLPEGATADDAADANALNPIKIGARAIDNSAPENLDTADAGDVVHVITDTRRRLICNVLGNVADGALADASNPVKVGAVAEADAYGATAIHDTDLAQLTTDLKRRLRAITAGEFYETSWVDSADVSADAYYPAEAGFAVDCFHNLTITGLVTCGADNSSILTIQVTNDEDATPASRDWQTIFVKDNIIDENVNQIATAGGATSNICLSLNGLGFRYVRVYYNITVGTTNKDTLHLKVRAEA